MQLEDALRSRRSNRHFDGGPIAGEDLEFVLWAAQGRMDSAGRRTCPSAGAIHPLSLRVIAFAVKGLEPGLLAYDAENHTLDVLGCEDASRPAPTSDMIATAVLGEQAWIAEAAAVIVIFGQVDELARQFETQPPFERWRRYLWMECGAAAQNAALAAASCGLAMTVVAGFDDDRIAELAAPAHESALPLTLLVLGRAAMKV